MTDWFSTKVQLQLAQETGMSQAMADLEFKVPPQDFLSISVVIVDEWLE